jgi:hypothetical protein
MGDTIYGEKFNERCLMLQAMSWCFSCVGLTLLVCALATGASAADLPQPGVCMREGAKLAGMAPVQAGKGVPQPRKIRNVVPQYPDLPSGTMFKGLCCSWVRRSR